MKTPKPYNSYNLYFILERALLLEARKRGTSSECRSNSQTAQQVGALYGYNFIQLPPLPRRYQHLQSTLPPNWFDPGRKKLVKRKHTKSHGVATFREISSTVAKNWRAIDPDTKQYVEAVALLQKQRYKDLLQMSGPGCLSVVTSMPGNADPRAQQQEKTNKQNGNVSPREQQYVPMMSNGPNLNMTPYCTVINLTPPMSYERAQLSLKAESGIVSNPVTSLSLPFYERPQLSLKPELDIVSDPGVLEELDLSEIPSGSLSVVTSMRGNVDPRAQQQEKTKEQNVSGSPKEQQYVQTVSNGPDANMTPYCTMTKVTHPTSYEKTQLFLKAKPDIVSNPVTSLPFHESPWLSLKPELDIVSDPGILGALHLSDISPGSFVREDPLAILNNIECGNNKRRAVREVDVSDLDILKFYHSIE